MTGQRISPLPVESGLEPAVQRTPHSAWAIDEKADHRLMKQRRLIVDSAVGVGRIRTTETGTK